MASSENSSARVASIAGRIVAGGDYTSAEALAVLGSALTQARNKTLPGLASLGAEYTSERIAEIAGRGLNDLSKITKAELRACAASVLTQAPGAHSVYR